MTTTPRPDATELESAFLVLRRANVHSANALLEALANIEAEAITTMLEASPADLQTARGEANMARSIVRRLRESDTTLATVEKRARLNLQRESSL